jgi:hypothetical protein
MVLLGSDFYFGTPDFRYEATATPWKSMPQSSFSFA